MDFLAKIRKKAASNPKNIVLPEGNEARIIKAAKKIAKSGIARIILLGKENFIKDRLDKTLIKKGLIEIIDPSKHKDATRLAASFYTLRKAKGMTVQKAKKIITTKNVYFAAMMVRLGLADGFVAGASYTTPNVAKAAIYCLEKETKMGLVSSAFIMVVGKPAFSKNNNLVFADCGIVPDPTDKQLATIAVSSAELARSILGIKPRVAMLSYSTKGSAKGVLVDKVVRATQEAKKINPDLEIDGELQLDAALIPEVAQLKAPKSKVAGKANVLVFPNLDSGNIAYKLTQRLAGARAVGPVLQGLTRPCSDLSRGCSIDDIVDVVALVSVRAQ